MRGCENVRMGKWIAHSEPAQSAYRRLRIQKLIGRRSGVTNPFPATRRYSSSSVYFAAVFFLPAGEHSTFAQPAFD